MTRPYLTDAEAAEWKGVANSSRGGIHISRHVLLALLAERRALREALTSVQNIISAFGDAAADPPLWRKLTELPVSPFSALSLIDAVVDGVLNATGDKT